uniref:Uncharacterized protein n=1 Tax=Moniliophthora roreri TaxID=221103 RepID=A0A0W0F005_MONRR
MPNSDEIQIAQNASDKPPEKKLASRPSLIFAQIRSTYPTKQYRNNFGFAQVAGLPNSGSIIDSVGAMAHSKTTKVSSLGLSCSSLSTASARPLALYVFHKSDDSRVRTNKTPSLPDTSPLFESPVHIS